MAKRGHRCGGEAHSQMQEGRRTGTTDAERRPRGEVAKWGSKGDSSKKPQAAYRCDEKLRRRGHGAQSRERRGAFCTGDDADATLANNDKRQQ